VASRMADAGLEVRDDHKQDRQAPMPIKRADPPPSHGLQATASPGAPKARRPSDSKLDGPSTGAFRNGQWGVLPLLGREHKRPGFPEDCSNRMTSRSTPASRRRWRRAVNECRRAWYRTGSNVLNTGALKLLEV
jgi:hypothetical protein